MEPPITKNQARKSIKQLGVPNPSTDFISIFYEQSGIEWVPRFNAEQMAEIFEKGNYPQLAKEYWEAKKVQDTKKCKELFNKALEFLPRASS